jgi:hypothetical protein
VHGRAAYLCACSSIAPKTCGEGLVVKRSSHVPGAPASMIGASGRRQGPSGEGAVASPTRWRHTLMFTPDGWETHAFTPPLMLAPAGDCVDPMSAMPAWNAQYVRARSAPGEHLVRIHLCESKRTVQQPGPFDGIPLDRGVVLRETIPVAQRAPPQRHVHEGVRAEWPRRALGVHDAALLQPG